MVRRKSEQRSRSWFTRKFYYLFTCEYCFSHYVAAGAVLATGYRLLMPDWRGAVLAWFALVWIANIYMSLFGQAAPRHQARARRDQDRRTGVAETERGRRQSRPAPAMPPTSRVRPRPMFAGPLMTSPNLSKRDPWHGQSHVFSAGFHATMQPRCGHTADVRERRRSDRDRRRPSTRPGGSPRLHPWESPQRVDVAGASPNPRTARPCWRFPSRTRPRRAA